MDHSPERLREIYEKAGKVGPRGFKPTSANFRDPTDWKFKAKVMGKSHRF